MVLTIMPNVAFAYNVDDQTTVENESLTLYVEQSNEIFEEGDVETTVEVINVEPFSIEEENIAPNKSGVIQYAATVEEAAAGLRSAMVERQTNVVVNIKVDELTEEALTTKCSEIFTEAIKHTGNPKEGDSLKWVWENWNCSISGTSDGSNCYATITYDITYYTTAEQEAALTSAVESLKEELNLDGKTDYEKVKAIYDYMVANISYDYTNLENDSHKLKYTAYAALVNKTSVCQGYATLFYRLALEYGIDTRVIAGDSLNNNGESEGHAWNIVKLGDKYYNLDATWDSTWDSDKTTHDFFLKGSDEFTNHTSDIDYTTDEFNIAYPIGKYGYGMENGSQEGDGTFENGVWTDYAADSFVEGKGTEEEPYVIKSAAELALLAKHVNAEKTKYSSAEYILGNDIDLAGHDWLPIGTILDNETDYRGFKGTFDGKGYSISNLTITSEQGNYYQYGLFGCNLGEIKNIVLNDAKIVFDTDREGWQSSNGMGSCIEVGAICGWNAGDVKNCKVNNVNIDVGSAMTLTCGGGIGSVNYAQVSGVYVEGTVKCSSTRGISVGGNIGDISNYSYMDSCSFEGDVYSQNNGNLGPEGSDNGEDGYIHYAGGFCGDAGRANKNVSINNCYAIADIYTTSENGMQNNGLFAGAVGVIKDIAIYENLWCKGTIVSNRGGKIINESYFWQGEAPFQEQTDCEYWAYNNCITMSDSEITVRDFNKEIDTTDTYKVSDISIAELFKKLGFDEKIWNLSCEPLPELITHSFGNWIIDKEATCINEGKKYRICTDCEYRQEWIIDTTSHNWENKYTIDKEATCGEEGSKSVHCSVCDATTDVTVINKLAHSWNEGNIIKEPTSTEEGVKVYICNVCGMNKEEAVPIIEDKKESIASGTCGDEVFWELSEDGTLTIFGEGDVVSSSKWDPYKDAISKVIVDDGVTSLPSKAFYEYSILKDVVIADSVISIGSMAFFECKCLSNIELSSNLESISYMQFSYCSSLKHIELPEKLRYISESAFYNCYNITEITLKDNVETIDKSAFSGCEKLGSLYINSEIENVNYMAFNSCPVKKIYFDGSIQEWISIKWGINSLETGWNLYINNNGTYQLIDHLIIPSDVNKINTYAFKGCSSLKSVEINENVILIETDSFLACDSLESVDINGVNRVEDAFSGCENLISFTLTGAVSDAKGLRLSGCTSLSNVNIADDIELGKQVFYGCSSLEKIILPSCMTEIGDTMFFGCTNLESITIFDSVTLIDKSAFEDCISLKYVFFSGSEQEWDNIEIRNLGNKCLLNAYIHYNALDHSYEAHVKDPTCTDPGYTTYTCECGYSYTDDEVAALGHVYNDIEYTWNKDFSSVTAKRTCVNDAVHVEKETVNSTYEETPATCTEAGEGKHSAIFENKAFETQVKVVEIPATGHNYKSVVTAPTCEEYGYTTYTCSVCNDSYVEDGDDPLDHDYEAVETKPTCTEGGYITYTCKRDATHTYTTDLDPDGHEMKEHAAVEATCEEDGNIEHYKCSKCEKLYADAEGGTELTEIDIIDPATGHSYGNWKTDTDEHWKECSCGDIIEKAAHDFEWKVDTKATDSKNGSKHQKCTFCNKQGKTDTIYKASKVILSKEKYTYDGGKKAPTVTVKDTKGKVIDKSNYSVSYASGRIKVGRYKVTVTFKEDYKGTKAKTAYFTIVPKAPSSASANLYGYDDVKFSWSKSTGASGYYVYYKKSTSGKYTYLTRTTKTSIKKANLSDGVKYYFKVVPYYKSGDTRYSALAYKTASVYTLKKLNIPEVKKSGTKIKVSWKNISGETGYQISQSTKSGSTKVVATYKTTKGTYKNITAKKGTKYYYKVRAYKQVGKTKIYGPWSKIKSYKR